MMPYDDCASLPPILLQLKSDTNPKPIPLSSHPNFAAPEHLSSLPTLSIDFTEMTVFPPAAAVR